MKAHFAITLSHRSQRFDNAMRQAGQINGGVSLTDERG
jgi:hypothetical protein